MFIARCALLVLACLLPLGVAAQEGGQIATIAVPFESARFMWDVAPGDADRVGPSAHVITCGTYSKVVEMPATSVFVKDVVPGVGTYACTIYAVNRFGKSAAPDPQFPTFEAGTAALPPVNLRLEVR